MSGAHERDLDPFTIRLRRRIGRRGASLLFFALVYFVYATALVCAPPPPGGAGAFLSTILPMGAWALPWAVSGLLCAVHAFTAEDRAGFTAASALSVGWSVLHLAGWALGEIPRGFVTAVVWLTFAAYAQVIAGWPEPARRDRGP